MVFDNTKQTLLAITVIGILLDWVVNRKHEQVEIDDENDEIIRHLIVQDVFWGEEEEDFDQPIFNFEFETNSSNNSRFRTQDSSNFDNLSRIESNSNFS